MKTRTSFLAAAALIAGTMGAAHAAEITLYSQPGFNGKQLTAHGPVSNVTSAGFNDQTSSIVVHSGRWEVCTAADFQGHCAVLRPGEYPRLDPRFDEKISSVRQIQRRGDQASRQWREEDGALVLFDQRGLRGPRIAFDGNVRSLVPHQFNDRTSSILIREGTWQICAAANFGGPCETLGPGSYARLGPQLSNEISSARRVDGRYAEHANYRPERRQRETTGAVQLFTQPGYGGPSLTASQDIENLGGTPYNDRVVSMFVNEGRWELCSDAGYRGQCIVVGPGRYDHLGELSQRLSSMRRVG